MVNCKGYSMEYVMLGVWCHCSLGSV